MRELGIHRLPLHLNGALKTRRNAVLLHRFALILLVILLLPHTAWARKVYRLGYKASPVVMQAVARLEEAYTRAGLLVEFVELPHKRSLTFANDGVLDGDVARISGLETTYPNLRRVKFKVTSFNGVALVLDKKDIFAYRKSLLDSYRVGGILGIVWVEKVMNGRPYEQVKGHDILFRMLLEGRVDILLSSELQARRIIESDKALYGHVRILKPNVMELPLFHYVNKQNEDIIPLLESALKAMESEQRSRVGP